MKVKSESEVTQSCLTPSDPMDCSLPGSSVHGIFQARGLEWVVLERVWRKGNLLTLLVGMQTSSATMENSVEIPDRKSVV